MEETSLVGENIASISKYESSPMISSKEYVHHSWCHKAKGNQSLVIASKLAHLGYLYSYIRVTT